MSEVERLLKILPSADLAGGLNRSGPVVSENHIRA